MSKGNTDWSQAWAPCFQALMTVFPSRWTKNCILLYRDLQIAFLCIENWKLHSSPRTAFSSSAMTRELHSPATEWVTTHLTTASCVAVLWVNRALVSQPSPGEPTEPWWASRALVSQPSPGEPTEPWRANWAREEVVVRVRDSNGQRRPPPPSTHPAPPPPPSLRHKRP